MKKLGLIHKRYCKAKRRIELGVAKPSDKDKLITYGKALGYK